MEYETEWIENCQDYFYPVKMMVDLLESGARGFPTPDRDMIEEENVWL